MAVLLQVLTILVGLVIQANADRRGNYANLENGLYKIISIKKAAYDQQSRHLQRDSHSDRSVLRLKQESDLSNAWGRSTWEITRCPRNRQIYHIRALDDTVSRVNFDGNQARVSQTATRTGLVIWFEYRDFSLDEDVFTIWRYQNEWLMGSVRNQDGHFEFKASNQRSESSVSNAYVGQYFFIQKLPVVDPPEHTFLKPKSIQLVLTQANTGLTISEPQFPWEDKVWVIDNVRVGSFFLTIGDEGLHLNDYGQLRLANGAGDHSVWNLIPAGGTIKTLRFRLRNSGSGRFLGMENYRPTTKQFSDIGQYNMGWIWEFVPKLLPLPPHQSVYRISPYLLSLQGPEHLPPFVLSYQPARSVDRVINENRAVGWVPFDSPAAHVNWLFTQTGREGRHPKYVITREHCGDPNQAARVSNRWSPCFLTIFGTSAVIGGYNYHPALVLSLNAQFTLQYVRSDSYGNPVFLMAYQGHNLYCGADWQTRSGMYGIVMGDDVSSSSAPPTTYLWTFIPTNVRILSRTLGPVSSFMTGETSSKRECIYNPNSNELTMDISVAKSVENSMSVEVMHGWTAGFEISMGFEVGVSASFGFGEASLSFSFGIAYSHSWTKEKTHGRSTSNSTEIARSVSVTIPPRHLGCVELVTGESVSTRPWNATVQVRSSGAIFTLSGAQEMRSQKVQFNVLPHSARP